MIGAAKAAVLGAAGNQGGGTAYRYVRVIFEIAASSYNAVRATEIELYDAQSTVFPDSDMTSNTTPSPLVASTDLPTGSAYRVFDGSLAANGPLTTSSGDYHVTIDLGSEIFVPDGGHAKIAADEGAYSTASVKNIYVSNTGAFSGEEVDLISSTYPLPDNALETINFD